MTKAERIEVWRQRIRRAKEARDLFFRGELDEEGNVLTPGVDFAVAVYRGKSKPRWWPSGDPWVHVGKLKSAVRAAVPSLLYSDPKFRLFPATREIDQAGQDISYQRAVAKQMWLNHIWREANGNIHARVGISNAFFSLGAMKCGYRCDFEDDKDRGVFARDDLGNYVIGEDGDPVLERGKYLTRRGERIRDEFGVPVLHPGRITKEKFWVEVTDPEMLLFDVESGPDFFQHRFLIEERVLPLSQVKNDPRYSRAVRDRLTATETAGSSQDSGREFARRTGALPASTEASKDEERVRFYDIYDFENDRLMALPEDDDAEFLLDDVMPAGMEHGPERFLKFTEDIGAEWYPIPDAIDMALVNQEYNITRSQMMVHRGHTKTRYLELPGVFDRADSNAEEEREKWATGGDATLIKVNDANGIQPAPKAQLDASFMQAIPNIQLDFNDVAGMPGEARGVADADTATQASILASGAELRNNDRRDNQVQVWLCEIARALLISGQANADRDSVVMQKIIEATGVAPFDDRVRTPEEMLGEYEVTVEIGSTLPKSDPRTRAQISEFMTTVAQNPWIGGVKGLTRRWLDSINLDPEIAEELAMLAEQAQAAQNPPQQPGTQQTLGDDLPTGMANMAGGAPTGAPIN